jgi:hypothetical protein
MADDKVNIGLSIDADRIVDKLEGLGYFEDRLSIAKFALAYAVKNNLDANMAAFKIGETSGTKWNIGSVDNDQYLRELIVSLFPESETPYRDIEVLMNIGLISLGDAIEKNGLSKISNFM